MYSSSFQSWPLYPSGLSAVPAEGGRDLLRTSGHTLSTQAGSSGSICSELWRWPKVQTEPITSVGNLFQCPATLTSPLLLLVFSFFLNYCLLEPLCWTVVSALGNTCTSPSSGPPHARKLWARPEQGVIPPQDNIPRKLFLLVQLECMLCPVRKQNLFYKPRALPINKAFLSQLYREEWAVN